MEFTTSRFGEVVYNSSDIITFAGEGILGFPAFRRYILIERDDSRPFVWLQSLEDPSLAFVTINPLYVKNDYVVSVDQEEMRTIELVSIESAMVLCFVTIAPNCKSVTANLMGPVIINIKRNLAMQVVLRADAYDIRHPVYSSNQKPEITSIP